VVSKIADGATETGDFSARAATLDVGFSTPNIRHDVRTIARPSTTIFTTDRQTLVCNTGRRQGGRRSNRSGRTSRDRKPPEAVQRTLLEVAASSRYTRAWCGHDRGWLRFANGRQLLLLGRIEETESAFLDTDGLIYVLATVDNNTYDGPQLQMDDYHEIASLSGSAGETVSRNER